LRLAYLVLPRDLVTGFINARTQIDGHPPPFLQNVVAEFLTAGHFGAHVRRMRTLYRARRDVLVEAAQRHLGAILHFPAVHAGLRATGHFLEHRNDREISARAARAGIDAPALSRYYAEGPTGSGLVLGYAALPPDVIRKAIRTLAKAIDS
jgi:GntR family transcriptional regulator/MocR family aminotransferase